MTDIHTLICEALDRKRKLPPCPDCLEEGVEMPYKASRDDQGKLIARCFWCGRLYQGEEVKDE